MCEHECNVGEKYVLPQAWAFSLSWSMATAQSSPPLDTAEAPGGPTGWGAPVVPIDKQVPGMDQGIMLAQVQGIASAPSTHKYHRA